MTIGKMVRTAVRTACGALAAAALAPAVAAADVEPNNSVFDPEGPLLGSEQQTGTVSPSDPNDWYVLYVDGVQQLHLRVPQTLRPLCSGVRITDSDGRPIPSSYTSPPGTTRFYVHARYEPVRSDCEPEPRYWFSVEPAAALVPGPAKLPVKGTREPNETLAEAGGPLLPGNWYFSRLETVNDDDWLRFYARPGAGRVDVETVTFGGGEDCGIHNLLVKNARGKELDSGIRSQGVIEHTTVNVTHGAKLLVHSYGSGINGCVGASAVVRVGPAEAIMSRAEVRSTCAKGRRGARRWARRVAADKRAIARAGGTPSRGQKRRLASDRRKLRSARRLIRIYC